MPISETAADGDRQLEEYITGFGIKAREVRYRGVMPDVPMPAAPPEQIELRRHLDLVLSEWGFSFTHDDICEEDGYSARCGWGTSIHVPSRKIAIQVWFDAFDNDIAIYGARPYREWQDLDDMATVLDEVIVALRHMLDRTTSRSRWWRSWAN